MSDLHKEERPVRSLAKAVTWRLLGTADTFIISWVLTGQPLLASGIALSELFTKSFLYYLHERGWTKIKWGFRIPNYNKEN